MQTKKCEPCPLNCELCSSATVCNKCNFGFITTIQGTCTGTMVRKYCKDGAFVDCDKNLTSECDCGTAINCESCTEANNTCLTCLPSVVKGGNGVCNICVPGFKIIGVMCWPDDQVGRVTNNLSGGIIAGIILGTLACICGVGAIVFFVIKNKRCKTIP
uniref:Cysteine-rich membrane protein 2 n=1 Tax=Spironucleus salmonicida TaxID=348837 RepID=V6LT14_9EUKA|eukprot:EST47398.1 Cysteine-rich membrane protein 2 [Spironucleus salmonicida]